MQILKKTTIDQCWSMAKNFIEIVAFIFFFCICVGSFVIWGYQIHQWLKTGSWTELPLHMYIDAPTTSWLGLNKIIVSAWDMNVGFAILFIPIICTWIWEFVVYSIEGGNTENLQKSNSLVSDNDFSKEQNLEIRTTSLLSNDGRTNLWYECFKDGKRTRGILFPSVVQDVIDNNLHDYVMAACYEKLNIEPQGPDLVVRAISSRKYVLEVFKNQ